MRFRALCGRPARVAMALAGVAAVAMSACLAGCASAQVPSVNQSPVANAGADASGTVGDTVVLNAEGSTDPDGDTLTCQWQQSAGPHVDIANANQPLASFVPRAADTYEFLLTVSDGRGGSDTDTVRCLIVPKPDDGAGGSTKPGGDTQPGGGTGSGGGGMNPPVPAGTSLTGSWTGDVTYHRQEMMGNTKLAAADPVEPTTVTFDDKGKPATVRVYLTLTPSVWVDVPTDGLSNPADQKDVPVTGNGGGTVTVRLESLAMTDTTCQMSLFVEYRNPQYASLGAVFSGPHTVTAAVQQDGSVSWQVETRLSVTINNFTISETATGSGTLSRQ